ncbi:MAG TPA: 3-hydroxyacyl-CoA dehydrogenase NAD-binding domain-containing protein [Gemmatimonadaceae bacterium]|nr:3-hydroxyacyl-CoA dehydrogenase NAD-binding domain-containing protein [Gemmatimonadaceae bacterium]
MANPPLIVGVVGAGAMGRGIAQVAAAAGHRVLLSDAIATVVDRARDTIQSQLARDVAKGRLDQPRADALLARIENVGSTSSGVGAFAECGIVIEAVAEDLGVKSALFATLEAVVPRETILATNTSSLSIAAIGAATTHAGRVVGMHFFNPAPLMALVEIVPAITTAPEVAERTRELAAAWGKTTVVATDTPGFIVNRVARPFYGEALRILEEGLADVATIDWALKEIGGFRMGPFELMDLIGNDVNFAVTTSVFEGFFYDPRYRPSLIQRRLVDAGLLGRKRERGYYDYRGGASAPEPTRDADLAARMVLRVVAMLVNEAIDAVRLRVAAPHDVELAMTKGVNYPRGLLAWGDEIGPAIILHTLEALQSEYGEDRYRPSPLLRARVRDGRPLLG